VSRALLLAEPLLGRVSHAAIVWRSASNQRCHEQSV
jgi:hypothetical protein